MRADMDDKTAGGKSREVGKLPIDIGRPGHGGHGSIRSREVWEDVCARQLERFPGLQARPPLRMAAAKYPGRF